MVCSRTSNPGNRRNASIIDVHPALFISFFVITEEESGASKVDSAALDAEYMGMFMRFSIDKRRSPDRESVFCARSPGAKAHRLNVNAAIFFMLVIAGNYRLIVAGSLSNTDMFGWERSSVTVWFN